MRNLNQHLSMKPKSIFSVKANFEKRINEIFGDNEIDLEIYKRGFVIQDEIIENSILFIGINPSFSKKASAASYFHNSLQTEKEYFYFSKFQTIAQKVDLSWTHLDLLFLRETNQHLIKDLYFSKDAKISKIINDQLDLSHTIIEKSKPRIIIISNAFAREIFRFKTIFCPTFGTHKIIENSSLNNIPVFFTSMLSGQRALDNGSFERLIWHVNFVKDKLSCA